MEPIRKYSNSPVSNELFDYFSKKFGQRLAPIALLKCCAVVSCKQELPRLSVMHVAPTRQYKTYTSREVMNFFDKDFLIDLKSDFTMNSLSKYKQPIENGKCLFVNDGTTLLASKSNRTKDRLVGGLQSSSVMAPIPTKTLDKSLRWKEKLQWF